MYYRHLKVTAMKVGSQLLKAKLVPNSGE